MARKIIESIRSAAGYVTVTFDIDEGGDARLVADDEDLLNPLSGYFNPEDLQRLAHAIIDYYEGGRE